MTSAASRPLVLGAFGITVSLTSNHDLALRDAVLRLQWLGWTPSETGFVNADYELCVSAAADRDATQTYELRCDRELLCSSPDYGSLIDAFENHAKLLTAARAEGRLFVHAGAVSWRGCGIIVPGRSGSGKTTIVRAMIEAGAEYYSDEFAVLDADGRLHPYALPLSIRGLETRSAVRLPIEALGRCAATAPVVVSTIVVTRYRARARWRPQPLSPAQTLLSLMDNTIAARSAPQAALGILRRAVLGASGISSDRGDARRAASAILADIDAAG